MRNWFKVFAAVMFLTLVYLVIKFYQDPNCLAAVGVVLSAVATTLWVKTAFADG